MGGGRIWSWQHGCWQQQKQHNVQYPGLVATVLYVSRLGALHIVWSTARPLLVLVAGSGEWIHLVF